MKAAWERFARWWCHRFHPLPYRPICGRYICPSCMRIYRTPW